MSAIVSRISCQEKKLYLIYQIKYNFWLILKNIKNIYLQKKFESSKVLGLLFPPRGSGWFRRSYLPRALPLGIGLGNF
jgi:hypothetical protein